MAVHTRCMCFLLCMVALCARYTVSEPPVINAIDKQIDITNDNKLKRQNEGGAGEGEEVDLAGIPDPAQPNQPGQVGNPQQPNIPGQTPFFGNGNPFFPQQQFFNNGFGFPGSQQVGFPPGFQQGVFPQGNYPQTGFQSGLGFQGRNIILQNNGKQYLVQPLTASQRVVQKNGKQYLLQPLTGANAGLTAGLPSYNVPNSALAGLSLPIGANAALTSLAPGYSSGNGAFSTPSAFAAASGAFPFSPAASAVQPSAIAPNAKLTSSAPQRVIVNSNGQKFEVEQIPIRPGQSPFLPTAVGGVAAQLAAQAAGQQYAYQYTPLALNTGGLGSAYSRANQAGYGLFGTGRSLDVENEPIKRDATKPKSS